MNTIASNLANAQTTRTAKGAPTSASIPCSRRSPWTRCTR
jgi:flagellar basal body rod protein FlgC